MNRIESVDTIRLLAIISVIAIHTAPFLSESYQSGAYHYLAVVINQLARFAVPFFFAISGYFWGVKILRGENAFEVSRDMGLRILVIFLAWSFIYLLPYNISAIFEHGWQGPFKAAYWHAYGLLQYPPGLILGGTKIHLWFLVALLFALFISLVFIKLKAEKCLLLFALALYVVGVFLKSYVQTPLGIPSEFDSRYGPFFSTLLFVSGYFIAKIKPTERWFFYGLGIFLLGCAIHFTEIYLLNRFYGTYMMMHDYVFGTYLMGGGAAVLALSNHRVIRSRSLSGIGKLTLGIYAIHLIFVDILQPLDNATDFVIWEVGYVFIVLLLSVLSTLILSKSVLFRRMVV